MGILYHSLTVATDAGRRHADELGERPHAPHHLTFAARELNGLCSFALADSVSSAVPLAIRSSNFSLLGQLFRHDFRKCRQIALFAAPNPPSL